MTGYDALWYLEWRSLVAELRRLLRQRGRLALYLLLAAYLAFILAQGGQGLPRLTDAPAAYAVLLSLVYLGLSSLGGRRRLLVRPSDLTLVVPSAIAPDRIVVWSLVRRAVAQLRLLVVVAIFWVPQMAASGGVSWGTLLYAVGATLVGAAATRYALLGLGRPGAALRSLLVLAFAALAAAAALALWRSGLAGLSGLAAALPPLAWSVLALRGGLTELALFGAAALAAVYAMVLVAPRIVREGVDWSALPTLAARRAAARAGGSARELGRRRLGRRDWPGRGDLALFGVEAARLSRALWPVRGPAVALAWLGAAAGGALGAARGLPWQVGPGAGLYLMLLTTSAGAAGFGQVLASPLFAQTPGRWSRKLAAWLAPGVLLGGVAWGGGAAAWLLGAGQAGWAAAGVPLGVCAMALVRSVGLLSWTVLPNAVDQRSVAVWLRFLGVVLGTALAAALFAVGYAVQGLGAGALLGCAAAVLEAGICLAAAAGRVARMDLARPDEGRA